MEVNPPLSILQNKLFSWGVFLAILAVFDTVFTDFGIRNGHIEEANPIMNFIYATSVYVFYFIKISLPLLLLFLISKLKPKLYFRVLIGSAILLYAIVLCKHIVWLSMV